MGQKYIKFDDGTVFNLAVGEFVPAEDAEKINPDEIGAFEPKKDSKSAADTGRGVKLELDEKTGELVAVKDRHTTDQMQI
jgi:hypothetical protein